MEKLLKYKVFVNEVLNENKTSDESNLLSYINRFFNKFEGKRVAKHGSHLRYKIANSLSDAKKEVENILDDELGSGNYTIEELEPADYRNGAKSGQFFTFKVILTNSVKLAGKTYEPGTFFSIVNNIIEGGLYPAKSLTPAGLKLENKEINSDSIFEIISNSVRNKFDNINALNPLLNVLNDVHNFSSSISVDDLFSIKNNSESIKLSKETINSFDVISKTDLNNIGKDFGEILGSVYVSNFLTGNNIVKFPGGNNPTADFYVDGYPISSKYKKGAAPSLKGILETLNKDQLTTPTERMLIDIFKIIQSNSVPAGYLEIAKYLNLPCITILEKIIGKKNLTVEDIIIYVKKSDKKNFVETNIEFYDSANRYPAGNKIDWDKLQDKFIYGVFISPISYAVVDAMNANPDYLIGLKEILSKLEIKQLYLDFNLNRESLTFNIKSFTVGDFKFEAPNQSIYSPANGKLGFKLI